MHFTRLVYTTLFNMISIKIKPMASKFMFKYHQFSVISFFYCAQMFGKNCPKKIHISRQDPTLFYHNPLIRNFILFKFVLFQPWYHIRKMLIYTNLHSTFNCQTIKTKANRAWNKSISQMPEFIIDNRNTHINTSQNRFV